MKATSIYSQIRIELRDSEKFPLAIYETIEDLPFEQLNFESSNSGYFLSKDDTLRIENETYKVTDFYLRFQKITTKNGIENNSTTFVIVERTT